MAAGTTTFENGHVAELALELYALGRLGDKETEELEEHILLCPACQQQLQEADDFIRAFRAAAPLLLSRGEQGPEQAPNPDGPLQRPQSLGLDPGPMGWRSWLRERLGWASSSPRHG